MHRLARAAIAVIPLLAALACGGRVGDVGGGGLPCPSPSAVGPGVACSSAGQVCAETIDQCDAIGSVDCTCNDGIWACPAVNTPTCTVPLEAGPPHGCPVAAAVIQGDSCDVPTGEDCSSDIPLYDCSSNVVGYASCECNGVWSCEEPGPFCPIDASTGCPAPNSIAQGVPCSSQGDPAGAVCPGNPTSCDGTTFYDAFECTNGAWNDVAATGCSSDGGGHTLDAGGAGSD
jgi:hypothetical protein